MEHQLAAKMIRQGDADLAQKPARTDSPPRHSAPSVAPFRRRVLQDPFGPILR